MLAAKAAGQQLREWSQLEAARQDAAAGGRDVAALKHNNLPQKRMKAGMKAMLRDTRQPHSWC